MELRHLRYFVAVAELLHFGRAAASLRIAQPSLSHQVRQLETELQTSLLLRTKRRVQLTEAGRIFLDEARQILAHADRAAVFARRASRGEIGRLRVGIAYWMDVRTITAAIRGFTARHRAIQLDLHTLSAPLQLAALREERLDVGFVRPPVGEPSLGSEILAREAFVAALPAGHRLAAKDRIPASALAREAFLLVARRVAPAFYDLVLTVCRDAGFVPHAPHEVDQPSLVLEMVGSGIGISLVPASARRGRPRGVVFRPLVGSSRVLETAVAWRRDNPSRLVGEFLEVVRTPGRLPHP